MFDVKDAATRHFGGDLNVGFESWVAFPRIRRSEWESKFGDAVSSRPDVLFQEDLDSSALGDCMRRSGRQRLQSVGGMTPPLQMKSLMAAFGDSAVLAPPERPSERPPEASLGERLLECFAEYRALTDQQQRLASQGWSDGPRLVRGVAGSGKTVVLATQVARMVERFETDPHDLFEGEPERRRLPGDTSSAEFARQNERAIRSAQEADRVEPRARAARYEPERVLVLVNLQSGCAFGFPPERVPGLQGATPAQLSKVRISPSGDGLHWDDLDVQASLTGLMAEALNLGEWAPRIMRQIRKEAKARAARLNGLKGGRPRRSGKSAPQRK